MESIYCCSKIEYKKISIKHSIISAVNYIHLMYIVNWTAVWDAIGVLPWRSIWSADNPVERLNAHLSLLVERFDPCAQQG